MGGAACEVSSDSTVVGAEGVAEEWSGICIAPAGSGAHSDSGGGVACAPGRCGGVAGETGDLASGWGVPCVAELDREAARVGDGEAERFVGVATVCRVLAAAAAISRAAARVR